MSALAVIRPSVLQAVTRGRARRSSRRRLVVLVLAVLVVATFAATLMFGQTYYPPGDVVRVILGEEVPGASFTVGRLRLPRAVLAATAGFSFGLAGVTFLTMLRNPLASPDIIGISSGASAAAAIAIVTLSLDETQVSIFAITAGLGVALLVYTLAFRGGVVGTRLILIGIGISAMLDSVTSSTSCTGSTPRFQPPNSTARSPGSSRRARSAMSASPRSASRTSRRPGRPSRWSVSRTCTT